MSDEHYFEVLADDVISKEQDPHVSGFTSDSWIALNSLGSHERAKVDDRHNHTPVGEVLSTGMSRDLGTSSTPWPLLSVSSGETTHSPSNCLTR